MKVLIVGLGYAGNRFFRALRYVEKKCQLREPLLLAYVSRTSKKNGLVFYPNVTSALSLFSPDIVIVTVNDENHAEILNQLKDFKGFVICEKPLCNKDDDLGFLVSNLKNTTGFCFDLIERYAETTVSLKKIITDRKLRLIRANFYWGKNRINDYRPTCGVTSEVIHALDIIRYLVDANSQYRLLTASGTVSDFSISGEAVLDSVMISAYLDDAVVTGYSSFVNISRKREIDLTFISLENELVYAKMIFDTPKWDVDYYKLWKRTEGCDEIIGGLHTGDTVAVNGLETIYKLVLLVEDVLLYVENKKTPKVPFPDLTTAVSLQKTLNEIDKNVQCTVPVKYVRGSDRAFLLDKSDLERLG